MAYTDSRNASNEMIQMFRDLALDQQSSKDVKYKFGKFIMENETKRYVAIMSQKQRGNSKKVSGALSDDVEKNELLGTRDQARLLGRMTG